MKNTADQFDIVDKLLQTKDFKQLTLSEKEYVLNMITGNEYDNMRAFYTKVKEQKITTANPSFKIKERLDIALLANQKKTNLLLRSIPLYKSVAAALIFLFIGLSINILIEKPTVVAIKTKEIIKYIDRPYKQIEYINVPDQKMQSTQEENGRDSVAIAENREQGPDIYNEENSRTSTNKYATLDLAQNKYETKGESLSNDTLLQKILGNITTFAGVQ